ncbi:MAG: class I SAM-dependent rRNA methyltransferase [Proteobacteria bacterium]|nr:class I SAM-dependent rRNA methyltransferase [Pseudomonadota bacterium]MCP4921872.1 class I SAM-dependent rRNA methyltransferase [Pseudomonadota bacterium]
MIKRLQLVADAVGPIARGHPWVYREGLRGHAEVGELVQLVDPRNRPVSFGIFDEGAISVRVLGREVTSLDRVLSDRLARADSLRFRVVPGVTDCWRVVNGAGDGLPGIVIDRYGELAVLRLYSKAWVPHLELITRSIKRLGWVGSIARRLGVTRVDGREGLDVLHGQVPDVVHVQEHGIQLLVRPREGQKTGLFLDQRENRRRVGELAPGRRVLNLFGYNGGFSIHAAMAGAAHVHTVDLSEPALEDAREIFRMNGLDPRQHAFEKADIFRWKPTAPVDLLICDPPSLTHGKKSDGAARTAYRDLSRLVSPWVSKDGLLAASSCSARLTFDAWERAVRDGIKRAGQWASLERAEAPADHPVATEHPEGRYLKFLVLRRLT